MQFENVKYIYKKITNNLKMSNIYKREQQIREKYQ